MINRMSITGWRAQAPWCTNEQVEQDLIICRALVAIFSDKFLSSELALRGGAALHKLYLFPPPRYSENIDLVQIHPGLIKPILDRLEKVLDFLPNREIKRKYYNHSMLFCMESEIPPTVQMCLKVEINCYDHFTELGYVNVPFSVENSWFSSRCEITTYPLNELLGTKLRALSQRKKGRDLFDLYAALVKAKVNPDEIIRCYRRYMTFAAFRPHVGRWFVRNLEEKMGDPVFLEDTRTLLRPEITYNPVEAHNLVKQEIIDRL